MNKNLKTLSAIAITVLAVSSTGAILFASEKQTNNLAGEKPGINFIKNLRSKNKQNQMGFNQEKFSQDCPFSSHDKNHGKGKGEGMEMRFFTEFADYLTTEEKSFLETTKTKVDELRDKHQTERDALAEDATLETRKALREKHQAEMKTIFDGSKEKIEAIRDRLESNTEVQAKMKEHQTKMSGKGFKQNKDHIKGEGMEMRFFTEFADYLTTEEKTFLETTKTKIDELRDKHQAEREALAEDATLETRKALREKHQAEMTKIFDDSKEKIEAIRDRLESNTEVQAKMKEHQASMKNFKGMFKR